METTREHQKPIEPVGTNEGSDKPDDFLRAIVREDVAKGKNNGVVATRFPPEPNGYLHIGHAKSICLNFGIAREFNGRCHLRMDDTNPAKEEQEYIDAIKRDIRWLGFEWGEHEYHASDYFQQLYDWAVLLIKAGKAFVCDLTAEQVAKSRGTLTAPGTPSPNRNRSVEENLNLFDRMRKGEFPDGSHTLRAKIDMASPNLNLRDPVMYRILHKDHPRTGNAWCIYPMYDYAHGQSDWIEGITHSICTLEFEDHRPLYEWFIDQISASGGKPVQVGGGSVRPRQYEFARLNLNYTMMSKRKLLQLVQEGRVTGWDDPRMPTLAAMRRRGYPARAIRALADTVGVARRNSVNEIALLEHCVREDLNKTAPRVFGVLNPLKVIIENYPEGQVEELEATNNPEDESAGKRNVPFSGELYIEREDFMEVAAPKFFRLAPGKEVRLRAAYYITCTGVEKDALTGEITCLRCTYDPATRGGWSQDGRKIKGTLHWVSAKHALNAEVRLYDRLFVKEDPEDVAEGQDWRSNLNPQSLVTLQSCKVEPSVGSANPGAMYQFERHGYFCVDPDSTSQQLVFNRTVSLKDSWAKIENKQGGGR
ncbi:MAG TPA: glutamine--tRNA ligase/YqeY domain fusion protein [Phycisphaerales bacterium]|nr:glutamine--tRNA ligase/YqeY domain fusion protein [Phycisphaerales bacterium]